MKASLAREWSLWHQLHLGHKLYVSNNSPDQKQEGEKTEIPQDDQHAPESYHDEKLELDREYYANSGYDLENGDYYFFSKEGKETFNTRDTKDKNPEKNKPFLNIYAKSIIMAFTVLLYLFVYISDKCDMQRLDTEMVDCHHGKHHLSELQVYGSGADDDATVPTEVFQVAAPPFDYGEPVFSQTVLNYTFANSWGIPAIVDYLAPSVDSFPFTHVVLQLDTTVAGTQYDRLGHIYLNNIPIWRTSTMEPAGKLSHSMFYKDVTLYNKLFREDGELMFQLDNLITTRLTGAFNVTLTAHYYDHEPVFFQDETPVESKQQFFNSAGEASTIIPIITPSQPGRPPLVYYPDGDIHYTIPKLSPNTTSVKLELFSTGNADEEFWYGNILDAYKDIFKGHGESFPGHGPCRIIHVYLDGIRVSTVNPYPIIYSGGLSPALWRPIVGAGTFDIKALEIDLTSLLPIFWSKSSHIDIKITNCLDDELPADADKSGIGNNWITTGSIVTWENPSVLSSVGEITQFDNSTKIKSFGFQPPFSKRYSQIVGASYTNKINSVLNYTLIDGTELNFDTELTSNANTSSLGMLFEFGKKQSLMTFPISDHSFEYSLINEEEPVLNKFLMKHNYGLMVDTLTERVGSEATYEVNVTKSTNVKIHIDGVKALQYKGIENGTSTYFVSPAGNHGFASTNHNISMVRNAPLPLTSYERAVSSVNGTVVYDSDKPAAENYVSFIEVENSLTTMDYSSIILENLESSEELMGIAKTAELVEFVEDLLGALSDYSEDDKDDHEYEKSTLAYLNALLFTSMIDSGDELVDSIDEDSRTPLLSSFY